MQKTTNYGFPKPEDDDFFNVKDFADMMDKVDETLAKVENAGGIYVGGTNLSTEATINDEEAEYPVLSKNANGGGVCAKSYLNSQMPGTKFCTPDYSIVSNAVNKPSDINKIPSNTIQTGEKYMFNPETVKAGDKNTSVLLLQEILRARGFKGKNGKALKLTWTADANTIYALKAYQESRKEVLEVDGICGPATWKDLIAI